MNDKYFKAKLKEIGFYDYTLSDRLSEELSIKVLQQIAKDQREACASVVVDLLEQDHSYDEVFKITEAIHNAEIEATDE